jgi:hypothetical protein
MVCTFVALTNSMEELLPSSWNITSLVRNNNIRIHRFEKLNSYNKKQVPGLIIVEMSTYVVGIHENEGETSVSSYQTARRHISGRFILIPTAVTQHLTTDVTARIFSKCRSGSLYKY